MAGFASVILEATAGLAVEGIDTTTEPSWRIRKVASKLRIVFPILFGFGAITMAFDSFYRTKQFTYCAVSELPKAIIRRMSYG